MEVKAFNEIYVLGGGEISGSWCGVVSNWYLVYLFFLQLIIYHDFFMDIM